MRRYSPVTRAFGLSLLVFASSVQAANDSEIQPGPLLMSAAEQAIVRDPSKGLEHAVVLLEETDRNEAVGAVATIERYHLRVKVLSSEARDWGNVTIPFKRDEIREWWGRVITPEGKVHELPITRLDEVTQVKPKNQVLAAATKAALPGVTEGSVIDYGYEARSAFSFSGSPIEFQRTVPVKKFRYKWTTRLPGAYTASYAARKFPIKVENTGGSVTFEINDIPPVVEEPLSPPRSELFGQLVLYYRIYGDGDDAAEYWKLLGKRVSASVDNWLRKQSVWEKTLRSIPMPADADLVSKLKTVYSWLGSNIKNESGLSFEEIELQDEKSEHRRRDPARLLQDRSATSYELQLMMIALARALGAQANVVWAVDRTEAYWLPDMLSGVQFDATLVAIRLPGEPPEKSVFVSPGLGLEWGQVPWQFTGATGVMHTDQGARRVVVTPAPAEENHLATRATVSFSDAFDLVRAKWSRTGRGQYGYTYRGWLRSLDPSERAEQLAELCGAGSDTEVATSEADGLDDLTKQFAVRCESERTIETPAEDVSRYHFSWDGPWLIAPPDLSEKERRYPVVFNFPRSESSTITIETPTGWALHSQPDSILIPSPVGKYTRSVEATDKGIVIRRELSLTPLIVQPADYQQLLYFIRQVRKADADVVVYRRAQ
jgi:hypothetical protein